MVFTSNCVYNSNRECNVVDSLIDNYPTNEEKKEFFKDVLPNYCKNCQLNDAYKQRTNEILAQLQETERRRQSEMEMDRDVKTREDVSKFTAKL